MTTTADEPEEALAEALTGDLLSGRDSELKRYFTRIDSPLPLATWSPRREDLDEANLGMLLGYWQQLPRGPRAPLAGKVDPLGMRAMLGYLMLLDVVDDGRNFRYRLYGASIAERSGFDATGRTITEIPVAPMAAYFMASYRACRARVEPLLTRHRPPMHIHVASWDRLILPLDDGSGNISRLLVGNIPGAWRP